MGWERSKFSSQIAALVIILSQSSHSGIYCGSSDLRREKGPEPWHERKRMEVKALVITCVSGSTLSWEVSTQVSIFSRSPYVSSTFLAIFPNPRQPLDRSGPKRGFCKFSTKEEERWHCRACHKLQSTRKVAQANHPAGTCDERGPQAGLHAFSWLRIFKCICAVNFCAIHSFS